MAIKSGFGADVIDKALSAYIQHTTGMRVQRFISSLQPMSRPMGSHCNASTGTPILIQEADVHMHQPCLPPIVINNTV